MTTKKGTRAPAPHGAAPHARGPALAVWKKDEKKPREYAPGWRLAGVAVSAKMRRSERGFRRDERVLGIWDVVKGKPGMWVVSRRPEDGRFLFLVGAVALAQTIQADRASLDPELVREKGGTIKPTIEEKAELARRNGKKGGRPPAEAGELREVYAMRLRASTVVGLKEWAADLAKADPADPLGKHSALAAGIIEQAVSARRKKLG